MFAHAGTHIDAPWHFNPNGKRIQDFNVNQLVFSNVLLLDIPKNPWETISLQELTLWDERIRCCDALLIRTGFGKLRFSDTKTYFSSNPGFGIEAAEYLAGFPNISCVGVDVYSVENLDQNRSINYPIHHVFLDRPDPILLLEDAHLAALGQSQIHRLYLFALRLETVEASPVRAVVEIQ
jgi:arylformamidase